MDPEQTNSNRRQIRNLIVQPKQQVKFIMYFFASGLILLLVVFSFVLFTLSGIVTNISQLSGLGEDVREAVHQAIMSTWVVFAVVFAAFAILSIAIGALITHRILGPVIPIRRHLDALKKGNYSYQGRLRDQDELKDVMDDLNELAVILEKRHGSVTSATK